MTTMKNFIKFLILIVLSNYIASIIISLLITISSGAINFNLGAFFVGSFIFGMFGLAFTIMPSAIAITIIKNSNQSQIWKYAIGGVFAPLFLYIIIIARADGLLWIFIIPLLAIPGAICGTIYGILDKKIKIAPKQEPEIQGEAK